MRSRIVIAFVVCSRVAALQSADGADSGTPESTAIQPSHAAVVVAAARASMQIIDLSQPLSVNSTYYPALITGLNDPAPADAPKSSPMFGRELFHGGTPFVLSDGKGSLAQSFYTGEHTGTHVDAPSHFISGGGDISSIAVESLVRPLIVIDVREEAVENSSLALTIAMIDSWEDANGVIPPGAIVCLLSGYEHTSEDKDTKHPGFSVEAAEFLSSDRDIAGVGTDSLSPDVGGDLSFPVHKRLLGENRVIIENMRNLATAPARGAFVLIAPLVIAEGSGSPARVFAFVGQKPEGKFATLDLTHRLDAQTPFVLDGDPIFAPLTPPVSETEAKADAANPGIGEKLIEGLKELVKEQPAPAEPALEAPAPAAPSSDAPAPAAPSPAAPSPAAPSPAAPSPAAPSPAAPSPAAPSPDAPSPAAPSPDAPSPDAPVLEQEVPVVRETTTNLATNGYYGGYFKMGVSTGTHVRFPRNPQGVGADAATFPVTQLLGGVVIVDLRDLAPAAALTAEELESRLGKTEVSGCFLVLVTGRVEGPFPGLSADAARLAMKRSALGVLSDAPTVDPSGSADRIAESIVHASRGLCGGFLRDPSRLPAVGATIAIMPMPIEGASSAPARILAYIPH